MAVFNVRRRSPIDNIVPYKTESDLYKLLKEGVDAYNDNTTQIKPTLIRFLGEWGSPVITFFREP